MKQLLSILLFTGIFNASFAQSPYSATASSKGDAGYTYRQNGGERDYEKNRSNEDYAYHQRGASPENSGIYRNDDNINRDRGYDRRDDRYKNDRDNYPRHDGRRYPEKKASNNKDLKAFGGGLIIGGLLGILIGASSH